MWKKIKKCLIFTGLLIIGAVVGTIGAVGMIYGFFLFLM